MKLARGIVLRKLRIGRSAMRGWSDGVSSCGFLSTRDYRELMIDWGFF